MNRRQIGVLLLPILALVFLFGWVMYSVGGEKANEKKRSANQYRSVS
jgi:hypothetical protein